MAHAESAKHSAAAEDPNGGVPGAGDARQAGVTRAIPDAPAGVSIAGESHSAIGRAMSMARERWGLPITEPAPDDPDNDEEASQQRGIAAGLAHLDIFRAQPASMRAVLADYGEGHRKISAEHGPLAVIPYHLFGLIGLPLATIGLLIYDANTRPGRTAGFVAFVVITIVGLICAGII